MMADPDPNEPDPVPEPPDSMEGALYEVFGAKPPESGSGEVLESIAVPPGVDPRVSLRDLLTDLPTVEKPVEDAFAGLSSLGRYQVFGEVARGLVAARGVHLHGLEADGLEFEGDARVERTRPRTVAPCHCILTRFARSLAE